MNMDKKIGRPRSEETRKSILSAAYELLLEKGFKAVTVDGIAERSGVSKATIYKWWPNKASVVLDGYFEATEVMLQVPDTGSMGEDLFIQANNLAAFLTSHKGRVITELIAEGQFDKNIAEEYRKRYFSPRRLISKNIIERGIHRGELRKDLDIELSIDLIFAPLFYRLLITDEPLESAYIKELISYAFKGLEAEA
jgi:Transcriptional regulator